MTRFVKMLKPADCAEMLGCSRPHIHHLIARGDLPAYRDGRIVRVHPDEWQAYLERCRISGSDRSQAGIGTSHGARDDEADASQREPETRPKLNGSVLALRRN